MALKSTKFQSKVKRSEATEQEEARLKASKMFFSLYSCLNILSSTSKSWWNELAFAPFTDARCDNKVETGIRTEEWWDMFKKVGFFFLYHNYKLVSCLFLSGKLFEPFDPGQIFVILRTVHRVAL